MLGEAMPQRNPRPSGERVPGRVVRGSSRHDLNAWLPPTLTLSPEGRGDDVVRSADSQSLSLVSTIDRSPTLVVISTR
jgi:hypothetical protein